MTIMMTMMMCTSAAQAAEALLSNLSLEEVSLDQNSLDEMAASLPPTLFSNPPPT
jgi:hypothetical protein